MRLRELGQQPVSEATPAGDDPRNCPEYERLLEETAKLSSLQGAVAVDWHIVTDSAASVLETRAKDIPAAVYLCVGLAQTEGLQGMADGTRVLADLLRLWWDVCFPPLKRMRARANMIGWWRERLAPLLDAQSAPVPAALRDDLLASLTELDATLADRLPDVPPLRDLLERVQRLEVTTPEPEPAHATEAAPQGEAVPAAPAQPPAPDQTPAPAQPPAPGPEQAPAPTPTPAPPFAGTEGQTAPPADVQEARERFLAAARACTGLAFSGDIPQAAAVWAAFYVTLWGRIDTLPPAEDGLTALPAPPAEELAACRNLLAGGRAVEAATALARLLPACPFCLDGQFLLFSALTACGRPHDAARTRRESRALAARLPGLTGLRFADGSPFASPETRHWLDEADAAPVRPAPAAAADADDVARLARETANRGELAAALDMLEDARRRIGERSARAFPLRIEQARLLLAAGHVEAAVPLAEELEETIARHNLADWQDTLSLDALRVCHSIWAAGETPDARQRAAATAAALCRLRPSRSPFL